MMSEIIKKVMKYFLRLEDERRVPKLDKLMDTSGDEAHSSI